jgi:dihydroxyacid dehydratase/phosphogluconate dehydratase
VHDLGKTVKQAVEKQGMLGWQYGTIGVSDGITMWVHPEPVIQNKADKKKGW